MRFEKKVLSSEDQKLHGTMRGKNTKYFLNLENRHCKREQLCHIKSVDPSPPMSISVLLEVVHCKCSKCTPVNIDLSDFTGHENDTIHKEEEQNICEGPLTETERLAALKTMETEKTPGWDGSVPAEFYKVF